MQCNWLSQVAVQQGKELEVSHAEAMKNASEDLQAMTSMIAGGPSGIKCLRHQRGVVYGQEHEIRII